MPFEQPSLPFTMNAMKPFLSEEQTRSLLESITKDEDGHVDWIEEQLDQIGQLGAPLYLSAQTRA